jgi:hypothetical protein
MLLFSLLSISLILLLLNSLEWVGISTTTYKQWCLEWRLLIERYKLNGDASKDYSTLCWLYNICVNPIHTMARSNDKQLLPCLFEVLILFFIIKIEKS